MSSHAVVLTPDAERQLADLYRHIADQSGVSRAEKFVGRILAECMSLSTFPNAESSVTISGQICATKASPAAS